MRMPSERTLVAPNGADFRAPLRGSAGSLRHFKRDPTPKNGGGDRVLDRRTQ